MLADLSHAVGDYLYNVFVLKLSWGVVVGLVGQLMFTMRFLVQWIASERAKKSVVRILEEAETALNAQNKEPVDTPDD